MRRIDRELKSISTDHRQENYSGQLSSTNSGGRTGNVNNLYNSQVRGAIITMPYGISSGAPSGIKAQTVVNDNSSSVIVGVYDPSRPSVGAGEICIYSSSKARVYLSNKGDVSIKTDGGNIDIKDSGVINISKKDQSATINITEDSDVIIKSQESSISISHDKNIDISNGNAGIEISQDNNIDIHNNNSSVNIEDSGKIAIYGIVASLVIGDDGNINVDTSGDIKFSTSGNIEFECTELNINGTTVP